MTLSDRDYRKLSQSERLRLVLAALARGDDRDADRLIQTAERVTVVTADPVIKNRVDALFSVGSSAAAFVEGSVQRAEYAARMLGLTPLWPEDIGDEDRPSVAAQLIGMAIDRAQMNHFKMISDLGELEMDQVHEYADSLLTAGQEAVDYLHSVLVVASFRSARSILAGIGEWCSSVGLSATDFLAYFCQSSLERLDALDVDVKRAQSLINARMEFVTKAGVAWENQDPGQLNEAEVEKTKNLLLENASELSRVIRSAT